MIKEIRNIILTARKIKNNTVDNENVRTLMNMIESKYHVVFYPYCKGESVSNEEFYEKDPVISISRSPYVLMFYYLFRKKYPYDFTMIKSKFGEIFFQPPKIGFYYTIYKNHIILCNSYYKNTYDDNDNMMISSYNVRLDIIGLRAAELYEKLIKYFSCKNIEISKENDKRSVRVSIIRDEYSIGSESVKNIDNIVMNKDNKNRLYDVLNNFNSDEVYKYRLMGIKKRLGILLYGPPGTGKSSLAYSIAKYFNYFIQIITPDDIVKSAKIQFDHGIVLFEELDSFLHDKGGNTENIVLRRDQLLSYIDAIPDNIIIIGTTNYIEELDDAIIRPGRFDLKIHMDLFSRKDAEEFFGEEYAYMVDQYEYPVIPSQLQFDLSQEVLRKSILQSTNSN